MGGERETTVAAKTVVKGEQIVGDVRVHENKGEIHFHADKMGLKVAVPVSRWFEAWEKLRAEPGYRRFFDSKTGCMLEVRTWASGQSNVGVDLAINNATISPEFAVLDKFTMG